MRNWESWPPLSLAQLAAMLEKNGHEVEIIDRNVLLSRHKGAGAMSATDADTRMALEDFAPQMVGITATTPLAPDAFKCAAFVKEILPDAVVVMGGAHASLMPERTLRECGHIDIVCKGEENSPLRNWRRVEGRKQYAGCITGTAPRYASRANAR